ncbi:hypothetical protein OIV83_002727 [Microbotryomycetes sp. JL201]|nr:hypothetical protein OIV83_002727 [Microbotryomycetes sp. JL201]
MTSTTSDLLQSLPTYDSSDDDQGGPDDAQTARDRRIEAARLAASSYKAKMEEPQWYLDEESTQSYEGPRPTVRPELFALEHYYLLGRYDLVKRRGLDFLNDRHGNEAGREHRSLSKDGSASIEDVQVLDAVMRSALKLDEVDKEVVEWARVYKTRPTAATLAYAAARVLDRAGHQYGVADNEPIEAALAALTRHSTLKTYIDLLADLLAERSPFLSKGIKQRRPPTADMQGTIEEEIQKLNLNDDAKATFRKVIGGAGQATEEQEELPRDVRSL